MLKITIPSIELYDEANQEFVTSKEQTIVLEHSLVSLSKWESKWCKPFLSNDDKTLAETIDYVECMTVTQNVDPILYKGLTNENLKDVSEYIDLPMTATTIQIDKQKKPLKKEIITSEIIYYWMIAMTIPLECQKWHLNRLLTLINVCNIKNKPKEKMSKNETIARNKALNEERRKKLNTTG